MEITVYYVGTDEDHALAGDVWADYGKAQEYADEVEEYVYSATALVQTDTVMEA